MQGVAKAIDELGVLIAARDAERQKKQDEIDSLNKRINLIEQYIDIYEEYIKGRGL